MKFKPGKKKGKKSFKDDLELPVKEQVDSVRPKDWVQISYETVPKMAGRLKRAGLTRKFKYGDHLYISRDESFTNIGPELLVYHFDENVSTEELISFKKMACWAPTVDQAFQLMREDYSYYASNVKQPRLFGNWLVGLVKLSEPPTVRLEGVVQAISADFQVAALLCLEQLILGQAFGNWKLW